MQKRRFNGHYLLRALILGGFSLLIVHLVKSGHLTLYIAPRMEGYVKYAAAGFMVIAISQAFMALWSLFDQVETCECEHVPPRSFWLNGLIYLLFILPLSLGAILPDVIMGSDVAAVKGMNLTASAMSVSAQTAGGKLAVAKSAAIVDKGAGSPAGTAPPAASAPAAAPPVAPADGPGMPSSSPAPSDAAAVPAPPGVSALPDAGGSAPSASPSGSPAASPGTDGAAAASPDNKQTSGADEEQLKKLFPADQYTGDFAKLGMKLYGKSFIPIKVEGFTELLTTLSMYTDNFIGTTMEISGFVYREPEMAANQFVVARLVMQCCSADAMPYGVLVESDQAKDLAKDTWVDITGTIGKTTYKKNEIMKLDAAKINTIKAPDTPYVYLYYGDYDKLAD